ASTLLKEDTEACHRSSASRAYYAAYHFCKPLAERLPEGRSSRRGSHQRLIDRLRKHAVRARTSQKDRQIRDIGGFLGKRKVAPNDRRLSH
ncbi:MAG: hypothetical protein V3S29_08330, partial [bacterium]